MTNRKQNRILKLSDFLRYRKNDITGKERNSIERELQKDPFASEAMEGYDSADPDTIPADIADLQRQLKKRVSRRGRLILYRIAAGIAILIAVSSLLILTKEKQPISRLAENYARPETLEIRRSKPVAESELSKPPAGKITEGEKKEVETAKPVEKEMSKEEKTEKIPENAGEMAVARTESKKESAEPDLRRAPAAAMAREKSSKSLAADEAISSHDTVRYSVISQYKTDIAINENYNPPQPVKGKEEFEKYVKENIRYPESFERGQKIDVIVSFLVRDDGSIQKIKVENNPGKSFSDEAIRLIKDGPAWKPAEKNGIISEDKVRVTIAFR